MRSFRTRAIEPLVVVSDPEMLQRWAREFGVDPDELMRAIEAVGADADQLQEELTGIPALRH